MEEASCAVIEDTIASKHSESQDKVESDETFDNPCQPCLSEDKQVESRKFCEDCEEFLCEACIEFHKKLTLTKKHRVINKDQRNISKPCIVEKKVKPLPDCAIHDGQLVDLFCNYHDKSICHFCAAINHAQCDDIISIEQAATNARELNKFDTIENDLEQTRSDFMKYILKCENDKTLIANEQNEALDNLEKCKASLIGIVENLKLFDETKIKQKYKACFNAITTDIKHCKKIESMLTIAQESVTRNKEDDLHKFNQIRAVKENITSSKQVLSTKKHKSNSKTIVYKTCDEVADALKVFKRLGNLECETRVYFKSAFPKHNYKNIKVPGTRFSSKKDVISSLCILKDGFLLVTDWENCSLRLVHNISDKNATLTFNSAPFDVCKLPNKQAAVTLVNAHYVKLISYDFPTTLKEIGGFDTSEKCRGISHFEDMLYVACKCLGENVEGPGHIRVYTTEGKLQKTILSDTTGRMLFRKPWKTSVSFFNELYIEDLMSGLLKIKDNNIVQTKYTIECHSAAFDEHGYVFVTSKYKNIIHQLKADGTIVADVLSEEDGLKQPHSIAFDCKMNILYVATKESSEIQMYVLDYE